MDIYAAMLFHSQTMVLSLTAWRRCNEAVCGVLVGHCKHFLCTPGHLAASNFTTLALYGGIHFPISFIFIYMLQLSISRYIFWHFVFSVYFIVCFSFRILCAGWRKFFFSSFRVWYFSSDYFSFPFVWNIFGDYFFFNLLFSLASFLFGGKDLYTTLY